MSDEVPAATHPPHRYYLMTSIPYVNGTPHIGFALEAIQSDTLVRFHRSIGDNVRFLSGTDENALTVVQAADLAGEEIEPLVERNAESFRAIQEPLQVFYDDFIRTSTDPRHFPGAQKLWRACDAAGDIYKRQYQGQYCIRCERFYKPEELVDDRCPIHGTIPELVDEENYFFRLTNYQDRLKALISSGQLRVQPEHRKEEILSFIDSGLEDFSISRRAMRGRGWGVPVPDDPDQVMYVWIDALSNYITALDYATDGPLFERYWRESDERVHVIGKDILRFHAVYWPALLLSAGLPIPTTVNVHEFLTSAGERISKSRGNVVDPLALVDEYGNDAVRYWLLREMPRTNDGDFTYDRLTGRYNQDLANDLGNLVNRSIGMLHRYRGGIVPDAGSRDGALREIAVTLPERVAGSLDRFDFRTALAAIWELVTASNRYIDDTKPWVIAKATKQEDEAAAYEANVQLDRVLADLVETIRLLAVHLAPFIPVGAERIARQIGFGLQDTGDVTSRTWNDALVGRQLPAAAPIFPRIEAEPEPATNAPR